MCVRKIAKSDCYLRHACPSVCLSVSLFVRMEQLGCHWTEFYEILYLITFRKSLNNSNFIKI